MPECRLKLDARDCELLTDSLSQYISQLQDEAIHTDDREYKKSLREDQARLERIRDQLLAEIRSIAA